MSENKHVTTESFLIYRCGALTSKNGNMSRVNQKMEHAPAQQQLGQPDSTQSCQPSLEVFRASRSQIEQGKKSAAVRSILHKGH